MSRKNYASRTIRGKLKVCRYLQADSALRQYVPNTVSFNRSNLESMAARYSALFVKPDVGSLGLGICKVIRSNSGYTLKEIAGKRQKKRSYSSIGGVYNRIAAQKSGPMIIQQGIKLATVNNRPYDIRVMVQRKPGRSWTVTGHMVKVGAAGKIVTNYFQGGTIYTIGKLNHQLGLSEEEGAQRTAKLSSIALQMSRLLSKKRSGMHEMGIDLAIDNSGRIWVLEVNSNHPQFHPLKALDRNAYRKMKEYARSYGRHAAK
ncbi:YheC/YheD family protein [Paenibacillus chungangensis]|uniref:YheC/YheD family protein n=1 Tax=Paenibacillus chungangensis TaxID=696535 RepID=A0ABW3HSG0_9BACL